MLKNIGFDRKKEKRKLIMADATIKKFFDNVQKKFNIQKIFKCLCTGNITKSNLSCNIHNGKKTHPTETSVGKSEKKMENMI